MKKELSRQERHKKFLKEYPQYRVMTVAERKRERQRRIKKILKMRFAKGMTYTAIGESFRPKVTKQRIEQIVRKYGEVYLD